MEQVDYILLAGHVLTMDDTMATITDGAVAVKGRTIVAVGSEGEIRARFGASDVIGGRHSVMLPGFVNTHTHAPMVYFRGMADDLPLKEWLEEHIWPAERAWLGREFVRDASELACLEMAKAGVTAFNDMYFFGEAVAESVHTVGIRAVLGAGVLDFPSEVAENADGYLQKAERFIRAFSGDPLVVPCVAPHAPYTCSAETYAKAVRLAERFGVPVHTHLSETRWEVNEVRKRYGKPPVEHLEPTGVLSERLIAAHCVWLEDREVELIARHRVNVSHCVESNLKLASGIAPVAEMLRRGIRVTFGTDGAASNNDLNVMSEMSTAAKLHKAVSGDPTALDARQALLMATRLGAEALFPGSRLGQIREGYVADIVMLNAEKPHLTPIYDIYSLIVYSARASDVDHVMVDGRLVVTGGASVRCVEEETLGKARRWAARIAEDKAARGTGGRRR